MYSHVRQPRPSEKMEDDAIAPAARLFPSGCGEASGKKSSPYAAIVPLLAVLLLINLTSSITTLPLNRLIEKRLCRDFYDTDHDVSEDLCKVDRVQSDLAKIMGAVETLWIAGGNCILVHPVAQPLWW
ncbi:hypothetical protein F5Y15DRAFT_379460 [Xylariaceae sp. FL0016]|nr:hypothetical protein F5Y15DRAFT_379460 [Xylariaceae sp. FL0016]